MSQEVLSFSHISTGYGENIIIKDVSLQIKKGEAVALIGSNGTGKTTLLKCITGLLPLLKGEVEICGRNLKTMKPRERARLVAVVPQSYYVDYDFTVEDIVRMGRNPYLSLFKKEGQEDKDAVEEALRLTRTDQIRYKKYNQLSGGQRQMVILARAIAQKPEIILLDEPTAALDLHHQIEVMELIAELNKNEKITIMAVLHDINMAARFCSRIVMLKNGYVSADGTPKEVINQKEMTDLYDMKLMIRENALFEKPEIIPIRVADMNRCKSSKRIHVIGGANTAVKLIEELHGQGHNVSAGVLSTASGDWEICKCLGLPMVECNEFQSVTSELQKENLKLMEHADLIVIANIPFGEGNIKNLENLGSAKGTIYAQKDILTEDYTDGQLSEMISQIQKTKTIQFYQDTEDLLTLISQSADK